MRRVSRLSAFCCLTLLLSGPLVHAERDAGGSYNLLLKAKLDGNWFVISRSNLATRNQHRQLFLGFAGAAIGYQLTDTWSLRLGYRHAWIRPRDEWLEEDRVFIEAYYANTVDGYRWSNRSRVELRYFDYRDDDIRVRNEVTVEAPLSLTPLRLRPYVEEELFYGLDAGRVEANWLGVGLAWRPMDGMKMKLGYRWNRFRVGDEWRDRDVFVAGLNLFF